MSYSKRRMRNVFTFVVSLLVIVGILAQAKTSSADEQPGIVVLGDKSGEITDFLRKNQVRHIQHLSPHNCTGDPLGGCLLLRLGQIRGPVSKWYLLAGPGHAGAAWGLAVDEALRGRLAGVFAFSPITPQPETVPAAVPVWLFTAVQNDADSNIAAWRMAVRARTGGGNVYYVPVPGTTADDLSRFGRRHLAARIILQQLGLAQLSEPNRDLLRLRSLWLQPPFDNGEFWAFAKQVRHRPVTAALRSELESFFDSERYRLEMLPLKKYSAIDLFDLMAAIGIGDKPYLRLRNVRGEVVFLDLQKIRRFRPEIVIGIDDETNLFRLVNFYRSKQQYSWFPQADRPGIRARPLGAFLHFRSPEWAPAIPLALRSALTVGGIAGLDSDPYAVLDGLPRVLRGVLGHGNRCLNCHEYKGVGGRAHHVDAFSGAPAGGYALPLNGYPRSVLTAFLTDQVNVARMIGVTPNHVRADAHELLLQAVYTQHAPH